MRDWIVTAFTIAALLGLIIVLGGTTAQVRASLTVAEQDRDRLALEVTTLNGEAATLRAERDALLARPLPVCPPVLPPAPRRDEGHQTPLFGPEAHYLLR